MKRIPFVWHLKRIIRVEYTLRLGKVVANLSVRVKSERLILPKLIALPVNKPKIGAFRDPQIVGD